MNAKLVVEFINVVMVESDIDLLLEWMWEGQGIEVLDDLDWIDIENFIQEMGVDHLINPLIEFRGL